MLEGTIMSETKAQQVKLLQLLQDQDILSCPLFQREYTWGEAHLKTLWEDIGTVLDGVYATRFLGALVFEGMGEPLAAKAGIKWVIDGQQRLVTLYLFLAVIAAELQDADAAADGQDLVNLYLASQMQNERALPRLRPTLRDFRQLNEVLKPLETLGMKLLPHAVGEREGKLVRQFKRIKKLIKSHLSEIRKDDRAESLRRLQSVILEKLEFVEIVLGDDHDANEVFDRLNSSGFPLAIVDLVRNDVMRLSMSQPELSNQLYESEWRPFEDNFPPEVIGGYFFPYALTIDPKTTKAKTFQSLAAYWKVETSGVDDVAAKTKAVMADLNRHVPAYLSIKIGQFGETLKAFPGLTGALDRLNRLEAPSSTYPYIFQAVEGCTTGGLDEKKVVECLSVIESFLVRRALVGLEPTGLHAVFKGLWQSCGSQASPEEVRRRIETNTIQFPTDSDFEHAVLTGELYRRVIATYVLVEYELDTRGPGDQLPVRELKFQKDHVLPQNPPPGAEWLKDWTAQDRKAVLHTFANLVLLTGPANALKNNSGFSDAQRILGQNILCVSTKKVFAGSSWTPDTVAARAKVLGKWSLERWPSYSELVNE